MKDCKGINELIHAYTDKETSFFESLLVEKHLKECSLCKHKISILKSLKNTLKEKISFNQAPELLKERVLSIPQKTPALISLPLRWAISFATAIVLLIGGSHFYESRIPYLEIKDNIKVTQHTKNCKNCRKVAVNLVKNHIKILGQTVTLQIHLDNCPGCKKDIVDRVLMHIKV